MLYQDEIRIANNNLLKVDFYLYKLFKCVKVYDCNKGS